MLHKNGTKLFPFSSFLSTNYYVYSRGKSFSWIIRCSSRWYFLVQRAHQITAFHVKIITAEMSFVLKWKPYKISSACIFLTFLITQNASIARAWNFPYWTKDSVNKREQTLLSSTDLSLPCQKVPATRWYSLSTTVYNADSNEIAKS